MLIDSLTFALEKSGCMDEFWGKLDAGLDATLGVASSARAFLVAARFAHAPQTTLAVVAGEEAAITFARGVAAYLGDERVLRFPERTDYPFAPKPANARVVAQRMAAAHALRTRREVVVVASARALVRCLAPADAGAEAPVALRVGCELGDMGMPGVDELADMVHALEARGYANTGELDGPGTFCVRGGTVDVFPGNLVYPVRLDFFGDELEEIRRIVPSTGQTIGTLSFVEIYPVCEFSCTGENLMRARRALAKPAQTNAALRDALEKLDGGLRFDGADVLLPYLYPKTCTLGDYAGDGVLCALLEPRSLFDDAQRLFEDVAARAKGTGIALAGLFADPAHVNFGEGKRATYVSIMRVGGDVDAELPVKRTDVAGSPDKLFGKLRSLIDGGYTVVFSAPGYRVREDMKLAFVDHGLPIQEVLAEDSDTQVAEVAAVVADGEEAGAADGEEAGVAGSQGAATDGGEAASGGSRKAASGGWSAMLGSQNSTADGEEAGATDGEEAGATGGQNATLSGQNAAPISKAAPTSEAAKSAHARAVAKRKLRRACVNVVDNDVPLGMIIPKAKLAIISVSDTQGAQSAARVRRSVDITEITFPFAPGDYVVHAAHGVAFFRELTRREIDGTARDYLLLEYAEGDKLFVPVEQLDRVTRYVGPEGASPRLTRLNTSDWSRALAKARKATKKLAFDLVDVYARRACTQGFRFTVDTPWQREMELAFPYQETPDQLAAIADVKADMRSARPMDRLICGDVGFGKTEVALRAAFAATQDKKQVMVLCPTTILAQQHYVNFRERFEPFGVTVEVLSRFRTPEQQAHALAGFASGDVSVLVGTHRLLSRDVNPHDLGLVIIDEEQRFGVGHKEQMKNLRESIDVLTLSATPIPRTMQMSLSGVRDMSLILTPPDARRPVKVHVGEWDPDVVSAAIRLELARKGQVYYVSNRVRSIDDAVARVRSAAEEARVGVAHGQMSREELEGVMEEFSAGELDVLVATTIIESGIDNPHTNTLIIEDAQRLGLAQMYQLKGRVGRSSTQAYAYFMFPDNVSLTEEATARLSAIDEHQDLGSGMRIAMRDLEIRGAGSLLGAEQHGNMSAVGFDLFAQMLQAAITSAREGDGREFDGLPPALSDITVNVPGHAYLPEEYMPDADERVLWYRRIASAPAVAEVDALERDLGAQRPGMPAAAANLFARARVKAFANEHGIKVVSVTGGKLVVEPLSVSREKMTELRRSGARYMEDKRKLTVPVRYFELDEGDNLMGPIARFLDMLVGERDGRVDVHAEADAGAGAERAVGSATAAARDTRGRAGADAFARDKRGAAGAVGAVSFVRDAHGGVSAASSGSRAASARAKVSRPENVVRARSASSYGPSPEMAAHERKVASARAARKARAVERGVAAKERLAEKRARRAQRGE